MAPSNSDMDCEQIVRHNVRRLRVERGLSQQELAWEAGVTRAYIGRIESRGQNLKLSTIAALAEVLEVQPYELLLPID